MKGTERQVKWAEEIRLSIHADVEKWLVDESNCKRAVMARDVILPIIDSIDNAEWFINNQEFDISTVAKLRNGEPDLNYRLLNELKQAVAQ